MAYREQMNFISARIEGIDYPIVAYAQAVAVASAHAIVGKVAELLPISSSRASIRRRVSPGRFKNASSNAE
jgi:hypothetical protein